MVGIMVGTIHSTIGIDHILVGVGRGVGVGTIHTIGVGGILITTILITTIDLRTTITHLIMEV